MIIRDVEVRNVQEVARGIFVLSFVSLELSGSTLPGQFINVLVQKGHEPLLRRPFSVYRVEEETVEIIFNVVGKGTVLLAAKKRGDIINILGPLGIPFGTGGSFRNAILIAGGLGIAPMPILAEHLRKNGKHIEVFAGARSGDQLALDHLENTHIATDDGSRGYHGTVVALAEQYLREHPLSEAKIFACGPIRMLAAVSAYAESVTIPCELSLEGEMACGIGICQGCPVERLDGATRYALVCTEGPTFDSTTIILRGA
ncbi:MAG: dihydroorotate dehydrogenase electron transfer subunit [Ignavibacteriales bacterium]|nr:dihydroorotate dehydrogenase electron transfer subunit [Ignavibacteriales bacterium]